MHRAGHDSTGQPVTFDMKALLWRSLDHEGHAMSSWELRGVLASLGHSGRALVKDFRDGVLRTFDAFLQRGGLCVSSELIPSRKSLAGLGMRLAEYPHEARDEFGIHTKGLILLLLTAYHIKRGMAKQRAKGVMGLFFGALLSPDLFDGPIGDALRGLRMLDDGRCAEGVDESGVCAHMRMAHCALQQPGPEVPQERLAYLLCQLFAQPCQCDSWGAFAIALLDTVAAQLTQRVPEVCSPNALNAPILQGRGKKRRLDEDLESTLVCEVNRRGLAPSLRSWARATEVCSPNAMDRVRDKDLMEYLVAGHHGFHDTTSFKLVVDGASVGEPPMELLVGVVSDCEKGHAIWAPPQVLSHGPCMPEGGSGV